MLLLGNAAALAYLLLYRRSKADAWLAVLNALLVGPALLLWTMGLLETASLVAWAAPVVLLYHTDRLLWAVTEVHRMSRMDADAWQREASFGVVLCPLVEAMALGFGLLHPADTDPVYLACLCTASLGTLPRALVDLARAAAKESAWVRFWNVAEVAAAIPLRFGAGPYSLLLLTGAPRTTHLDLRVSQYVASLYHTGGWASNLILLTFFLLSGQKYHVE